MKITVFQQKFQLLILISPNSCIQRGDTFLHLEVVCEMHPVAA